MARAARDLGHEYIALTDHSPRLTIANGLSRERLLQQLDIIAALNEDMAPFRILSGIEVDILEDGGLDQDDEILARLDVVVDFAGRFGQTLYLRDAASGVDVLQFRVTQDLVDNSSVPSALRALPVIGEPTRTRSFSFDKTDGHWTINGLRFDPNRVDALPVLGTTEKWVFQNPTGAPHTVHLHGIDQQCVTRNGGACFPYETMKETWLLDPGETIEVKLKFTDFTGRYVFHCHMTEHEDDGMMSQFEVVPPTVTPTPTRTPTPTPTPTSPPPGSGASFHTVPPCRIADTRSANGPLGGPALETSRPADARGE